jgi:hypothetical protein
MADSLQEHYTFDTVHVQIMIWGFYGSENDDAVLSFGTVQTHRWSWRWKQYVCPKR